MQSLEEFWTYLYRDVFREDDFMFYAVGTLTLTNVVFWGLSGLFLIPDVTGKPAWALQYKVQPGVNQPVDPVKLRRAVKVALMNHTLISTPLLLGLYPLWTAMGGSVRPEHLPTGWRVVKDLLVIVAVQEAGFYYTHRLAHWGALYRRIHKQHHEWTAPIGIVSVYAHPLEHIVCNLMPFVTGATLMGTHMLVTWIWYTIGLTVTVITHSDYHLPFVISPERHDFHHKEFNVNYGTGLGFLDWVHGTDHKFKKSKAAKRHRILLNLTPARVRYPD